MHHVLVIDDDVQVRDMLREMLARLGCEVTAAESGAAGIRCLESQAFALVITDMLMPGMDGIEFIGQARARWSVPIVALTGGGPFARFDTLEHGTELGAVATLTKPVDWEEFADVVEQVLGTDATRRQDDSAIY
jgi:CheY-like chemotaxis protein